MIEDNDDKNGSYNIFQKKLGKTFKELEIDIQDLDKVGIFNHKEGTKEGDVYLKLDKINIKPKLAVFAFLKNKPLEIQTEPGEFNQGAFRDEIEKEEYSDLQRFWIKYDGLCDLICNYMLINGLLDKDIKDYHKTNFSASHLSGTTIRLDLKKEITLSNLQKSGVQKTHILDVMPFYKKIIAFFFRKYPFNLLDSAEQGKVVKQNTSNEYEANPELIKAKLKGLPEGMEVKFMAFKRGFLRFEGHSMLIKKMGDNNFIFFDPNHGLSQKLTADELITKINTAMKENQANDIAFIDAKKFLHSLGQTVGQAKTPKQDNEVESPPDERLADKKLK